MCHYSKYFLVFDQLSTCDIRRLAYNGPAALRSGGFHKCSCGVQMFIYAQHFPRGYCRRCAKPQVVSQVSLPHGKTFSKRQTKISNTTERICCNHFCHRLKSISNSYARTVPSAFVYAGLIFLYCSNTLFAR